MKNYERSKQNSGKSYKLKKNHRNKIIFIMNLILFIGIIYITHILTISCL